MNSTTDTSTKSCPTKTEQTMSPFKNGEEIIESFSSVNLLCPFYGIVNGTLILTNFNLHFRSSKKDDGTNLSLPLGVIYRIEKFGNLSTLGENAYGMQIYSKDLRDTKLSFKPENHSRRQIYQQLYRHAFPLNNDLPIWAFLNRDRFNVNGWHVYNPKAEYERMGLPDESWRLTDVNKDYSLCDTYPKILCVPREASDDTLRSVASFRSRGRIPVLSWKNHHYPNVKPRIPMTTTTTVPPHQVNNPTPLPPTSTNDNELPNISDACIIRGAQPLSGFTGASSSNDKAYIRMILDTNSHFSSTLTIFDARPRINAVANKAKGGGFESEEHYKDIEFVFLDIPNIHVMRDSYKKLVKECYPYVDEMHWFSKLESTKWLDHIRAILFGALKIVDKVDNQQSSVFIHCSDGWDRTSQLSALSMLMLDPYYRTIEGFEVLIEKEWLSFGHKFSQRHAHGYDNYHNDSHKNFKSTSNVALHNGNDKTLEAAKPLKTTEYISKNIKIFKGSQHNNSSKHKRTTDSITDVSLNSENSSWNKDNDGNTIKNGSSKYKVPKNKTNEISPVFLQFIDCVYQLTRQFPSAFEFDQHFLMKIMDSLYASTYGTFLGNCDKERHDMEVFKKTQSLWSEINSNVEEYVNPFYYEPTLKVKNNQPSSVVLYPIVTLRNLEFWNELYLRWNPYTKFHEPFERRNFKNLQNLKRRLEEEVFELTERLDTLQSTSGSTHLTIDVSPTKNGNCSPNYDNAITGLSNNNNNNNNSVNSNSPPTSSHGGVFLSPNSSFNHYYDPSSISPIKKKDICLDKPLINNKNQDNIWMQSNF